MRKQRDEWIGVRVATPLRRIMEEAAEEEGRVLSEIGRRIWIQWAEKRLAEREAA